MKRKRNLARADIGGMRAFHTDYPEAKMLVLYGGDKELLVDGINVVPIKDALPRLWHLI